MICFFHELIQYAHCPLRCPLREKAGSQILHFEGLFFMNLIKKATRGAWGQKLPILRRHSLWTAPECLTVYQAFEVKSMCLFTLICVSFLRQASWLRGWTGQR